MSNVRKRDFIAFFLCAAKVRKKSRKCKTFRLFFSFFELLFCLDVQWLYHAYLHEPDGVSFVFPTDVLRAPCLVADEESHVVLGPVVADGIDDDGPLCSAELWYEL